MNYLSSRQSFFLLQACFLDASSEPMCIVYSGVPMHWVFPEIFEFFEENFRQIFRVFVQILVGFVSFCCENWLEFFLLPRFFWAWTFFKCPKTSLLYYCHAAVFTQLCKSCVVITEGAKAPKSQGSNYVLKATLLKDNTLKNWAELSYHFMMQVPWYRRVIFNALLLLRIANRYSWHLGFLWLSQLRAPFYCTVNRFKFGRQNFHFHLTMLQYAYFGSENWMLEACLLLWPVVTCEVEWS